MRLDPAAIRIRSRSSLFHLTAAAVKVYVFLFAALTILGHLDLHPALTALESIAHLRGGNTGVVIDDRVHDALRGSGLAGSNNSLRVANPAPACRE
jgi:hypothetical protein